jgi:putative oxidoreductase
MRYVAVLQGQRDPAYTLLRIMTGIVLTYHGYQKIFVIGLNGVAGFFGKIGIPLSQISGPFIGILEFVGGILVILGLFTRLLGALFAIEFIVATYAAWVLLGKGYGGSELELMLLFANVLIATHGSGRYSVGMRMGRDM